MATKSVSLQEKKQPFNLPFVATMLIVVGLVSIVTAGIVSINLSHTYRQQPPRRTRQSDVQSIRDWMTLHYIARSYGTPVSILEKDLNIKYGTYTRQSIAQIAKVTHRKSSELISIIQLSISAFQSAHPTPPTR